jgi:hypothetical protein
LEKERQIECHANDLRRKEILKEIGKKKIEMEENGHAAY